MKKMFLVSLVFVMCVGCEIDDGLHYSDYNTFETMSNVQSSHQTASGTYLITESSEDIALGERPTSVFEYNGISYCENLDGFYSGAFLQRADGTAELYVSEMVSPVMEGEEHLILDVVTDYAENEYIGQWTYIDMLWERYMLPDGRILCISDYEDESAEHLLNEGDCFKMMLLFAPYTD